MATTYSQQYRPITLHETGDTNALSVRDYRDAARNANVLRNYITPWQYHSFVPTGLPLCGSVEKYACQFGPVPWLDGFSSIRVELRARNVISNNLTVKVYGYMFPFVGSATISASSWNGFQTVSGSMTVAPQWGFHTATLAQPIFYDANDPIFYLIVTADGVQSEDGLDLMTFDAWPVPVADVA